MNELAYWAHETAIVDSGAKIGRGTKIWHYSHVCGRDVHIGEDCSFGQNVYVGPDVTIGRGVRVQNNVSVYDRVELEDYVFCGPSAVFTNVINPRAHVSRKDEFRTTKVRAGATLGANCTIVCGVEIGRFALVAAGAVVTKDVAEFSVVKGVPARHAGWVCHCGELLKNAATPTCTRCGSTYRLAAGLLRPNQLEGCFVSR